MTERERLPNRRRNETINFVFGGVSYSVTVGYFDDHRPAEIFVDGAKIGSHLASLLDDCCIMCSILLQYGATPAQVALSMGRTGDSEPSSILGVIANLLATQPSVRAA